MVLSSESKSTYDHLGWILFIVATIIVSWSIIIMPSFIDAQWGHADDGVDIMWAQEGLSSAFKMHLGRTFFGFLTHNWFMYKIGGLDPNVWYFIQAIELLFAMLFLFFSIYKLTASLPAGAIASILLITSSPIAEAYYTLSKAETLLVFFCSLLLLVFSFWKRGHQTAAYKIVYFLISAILAGFAVFTKETGLFFMLIWMPALVVLIYRNRIKVDLSLLSPFYAFLVSFLISITTWLYIKLFYASRTQSDYTAFIPFKVAYWNIVHYTSQSADVLIILGLAFLAGAASITVYKYRTMSMSFFPVEIILGVGSFISGLAYFVLLLAWNQGHAYYMLPVSLLSGVSLSLFIAILFKFDFTGKRTLFVVLFLLMFVSRLFSLPYIHHLSTVQRDFDRLEASVRSYVKENRPSNNRLLDMDWQYFEEPVFENTVLLSIDGVKDLKWIGTAELYEVYNSERGVYNAKKSNDLDDLPVNERDVFLFSHATNPSGIVLRGIRFIAASEMQQHLQLLENNFGRKLREIKRWEVRKQLYRPWTLGKREYNYQKVLYEVDGRAPKSPVRFNWSGVFPDHYTARRAVFNISTNKGHSSGHLRISIHQAPDILEQILPLNVELKGKNKRTLKLHKDNLEDSISVSSLLPGGNGNIELVVNKPWVPQKVNPSSGDTRSLGVEVKYIPAGILK